MAGPAVTRYPARPPAPSPDPLTLREQVIAPILAGIRRLGPGRPPKTRTQIDRDYEIPRGGMRNLAIP
jgi:hypothetical protein